MKPPRGWVLGCGSPASSLAEEHDSRLDRLVRLTAQCLGVQAAAIGVFGNDGLRWRAYWGPEALRQELAHLAGDRANTGREPAVIPDTRAETGVSGCGRALEIRFFAGFPLIVSQTAVGMICIGGEYPRILTAAECSGLSELAALAAEALQSGAGYAPLPAAGENVLQFLDASSDLVLVHDVEGRVLAVNKTVERVTGYSRQEIEGVNIDRLLTPESRIAARQMALESLGGAGPVVGRLSVITRDGRRINLEVSSRPLFGEGRPVGVQSSARDITARLETEAQLSEKRSELEVFASHLRQLHRLSTTKYDSIESLVNDHLAAGCEIFRVPLGLVVSPDGRPPIQYRASGSADDPAANGARIEAPVLVDGDVAGVLSFRAHTPDRSFTTHEVEIVEMLAKSIGRSMLEARMRDQLAYQARHDPLTGLANRAHQQDCLEAALARARCDSGMVAVVFLDLDRFKQINDTLGHAVGDQLLCKVGERLNGLAEVSGHLARMGGDEFTAVLKDLADPGGAVRIARAMLEALREPFNVEGYELFITASLGVSIFPADAFDADMLLRNADTAMYRVKNSGRNDLLLFTPEPGESAIEKLELENHLRRAVENGEFRLWFQSQMRFDGSLDGLEVLLVWENPKLGRIYPSRFIPLAEENGLIVPIGSWVLTEACRQSTLWRQAGLGAVKVAVNVSALQFARTDFVSTVADALRESGLDPRLLELELTESYVMRDVEGSIRRMSELRELGVSIAIDDFGTGYSSLSYLHSLPVNTLKIDRSFLSEVHSGTQTLPLIQTIITLAHNMELEVVAEGVETREQLALLRKIGCDKVQGHLFGEPMSLEEVERLLRR